MLAPAMIRCLRTAPHPHDRLGRSLVLALRALVRLLIVVKVITGYLRGRVPR
jgi:hypothetical protein